MKDQQQTASGKFLLLLSLITISLFKEDVANAQCTLNTVLDIKLSDLVLDQFSYIPTYQGYEFGYTLPNGTHRDEVGELINQHSTPEEIQNANNFARNARPPRRQGIKNRKLSAKSLSSLAG